MGRRFTSLWGRSIIRSPMSLSSATATTITEGAFPIWRRTGSVTSWRSTLQGLDTEAKSIMTAIVQNWNRLLRIFLKSRITQMAFPRIHKTAITNKINWNWNNEPSKFYKNSKSSFWWERIKQKRKSKLKRTTGTVMKNPRKEIPNKKSNRPQKTRIQKTRKR